MPVKKATKKFEKSKLKGELERRNARKKVKQRQQHVEKRKTRKIEDNGGQEAKPPREKDTALKNMTMDEFFQEGVDIPQSKAKKGAKKRKREEKEDEAGNDSGAAAAAEHNLPEFDSEDGSEEDGEGAFGEHKGDLAALAEKDPEFYKYLQDNDAELLDFEASDNAEESNPPKKKEKKVKDKAAPEAPSDDAGSVQEDASGATEISSAMIEKWTKNMIEQHSITSLREVVLAFRAAVHTDDDENQVFKYSVSSPDVYHQLLVAALQHIPAVLNHHLPVKEAASGKTRISTDSKKFSNLSPILNTHTNSIIHLLSSLSDPSTLKLTISSLTPLLPYILSFKKVIKSLLKSIVSIWSDASNTEATRINAFLLVRRLAVTGDASIREAVLRSTYQALVRSSRTTTPHTLSAVNLLKNSAVELWGLDASLSYTTGFTSIRQLAIHLRNTITHPTKDSYKAIYNWQYVHSLDFWSRVLSQHCSPASNTTLKKSTDSPLHPLIYPLVQITLGALRLIPTSTYFPLRFHLVQALLRISQSTNTYIPLAPCLLEVLQSPELRQPAKPATLKPLDFTAALRAPKAYLRTRIYQDGAGEHAVLLLAEFFGVWAKSIAFPELIIPPTVLLKRWLKDAGGGAKQSGKPGGRDGRPSGGKGGSKGGNRNGKLNASVGLLVQKLAANAAFVEQRRAKVEFAVSDRRGVDGFLKEVEWEDMPLGAFVQSLRRQRLEMERVLEASRRDAEASRDQRQGRNGGGDGDVEDSGDGVDEEEEMEDGGFEDEDEDMEDGEE